MRYDYVVLGAGVSGITSATILARRGYSVALVEAAPRTAPLLRGFTRHGVRFDTGFHYTGGLGDGEPLDLFFRHLGLSDRIDSVPLDPDGYDVFLSAREGFEFRLPTGFEPLRDRLSSTFPRERGAVDEYLRMVRGALDSIPYLSPGTAGDPGTAIGRLLGPTLAETLRSLTADPLLTGLLSMQCLLYGVPPEAVSFLQHAFVAGSHYRSARGVRGGGAALAEAYDRRLAELGVDVLCGRKAASLSLDAHGAVSGVLLDCGSGIRCGGCVFTLHPRLLPSMIPEGSVRPAWRKRLSSLEESVSAYILYAAAEEPVPLLDGRNFFLYPHAGAARALGSGETGENPLYVAAARGGTGEEALGYVAISPVALPDRSPDRDNHPRGEPSIACRALKTERIDRIRRAVQGFCPGIDVPLRHVELSTPGTIRNFAHTPLGGLYGASHRVGQHNPGPATRIPGLVLAGQAVTSPGLLGATLSGFMACGTILGHDRIEREIRACR